MEKIITYETLHNFAYCNDRMCKKPVAGIVMVFPGLGSGNMIDEELRIALDLAEQNILFFIPYVNPWSWMNRQTVEFTDEIIAVLKNQFNLSDDVPVVATGGSMGGLSALVYTKYAAHTPVACVANCPVCDLPYHFTERLDLPRTLYSAFGGYECSFQDALESASPLHLVDGMPDVEYILFHAEKDEAVNKEKHSDIFVERMRKSHRITYYSVPDMGHCGLTPELEQIYNDSIIHAIHGKEC